jgi:uncharacterized membrane protein
MEFLLAVAAGLVGGLFMWAVVRVGTRYDHDRD